MRLFTSLIQSEKPLGAPTAHFPGLDRANFHLKILSSLIRTKLIQVAKLLIPATTRFPDFDQADFALINKVQPFTLTSPTRIFALIRAVEYVANNDIPGDIVECGVWKGGSIMVAASTLLRLGKADRHLYLFDTFDDMTEPTEDDVSAIEGFKASTLFAKSKGSETGSEWAYASLDQVREAVLSTGYDADKVHFIKGKVEDTLPENGPEKISLLRLDTDWYESTRHELIHLFPRLSTGGVIIIDDYGHWLGARKAVDEYLNGNKISLLLNRIDYTGRIGVKCYSDVQRP